ncbi:hypothetical protein M422DRAFT_261281 [Sphaerobolus stellatus SS14]|uniref:Unplaced genomic scaffold SPHSTscaffold_104, whole genome shotgun sequence n=1 Tax=Sphaerobolus stellatus (strain SS14) TaxID=990650 RepID=A0A0C9VFE6_SPHS4|nr:hypothetical protein M422DRAFT_261281 [Sphaerobolus stellatus SS14]
MPEIADQNPSHVMQGLGPYELIPTKIFDFGSAHYAGKLLIKPHCVAPACSPEFAFGRFIKDRQLSHRTPRRHLGFRYPSLPYRLRTPLFNTYTGFPYVTVKMADYVPFAWKNWYDDLSHPSDLSPGAADSGGHHIGRNCDLTARTTRMPVSIASTPTLPMLTPGDFYFQSKGMKDITRYVPGGPPDYPGRRPQRLI